VALRSVAFACLIAIAAAGPVGAQTVTLEDALNRTANYIDYFVDQFTNVVSEELYRQEAVPALLRLNQLGGRGGSVVPGGLPQTQKRTLKSDFLLVKPADSVAWLPFRDVYEVNGSAIRDREGRLAKLFLKQSTTSLEQASQIALESSRYNIGDVTRTINNPVIALAFLTRDNQSRFEYTLGKIDSTIGPAALALEFKEQARPTLIRGYGDSNLPTSGHAWIDADTGHVLKTEFLIDDVLITARVTTTFKLDERLQIHVPAEMTEEYKPTGGGRVTGRATYGRFRQFAVRTDEEIHKPEIPKRSR
jgi:hypothetical protein